MSEIRQAFACCAYNFRQWAKNPRVIMTFALGFVLCFLLSDKAVRFATAQSSVLQLMEPFVWTFGDANNILISSLLLVLLFSDMPFTGPGTPFFLVRTTRRAWLMGQVFYIFLATAAYLAFILAATCVLSAQNAFAGNQWSETAALLGYSGTGQKIALPAFVKTLELSRPYACTMWIFILMLLYTLVLVSLMLAVNLWKGQRYALVAVFLFSLYGFALNPQILAAALRIPEEATYKANVLTGWLSPLNQATYHMHNFGYDMLPRLWQSCAFFGVLTALLLFIAARGIRSYNFSFTGTET